MNTDDLVKLSFFSCVFINEESDFPSNNEILNQIFINWELSPISDYYLNNNNYNISCKDEYENAFTYEFPGLINGCDCSNSNSKTLKNKSNDNCS